MDKKARQFANSLRALAFSSVAISAIHLFAQTVPTPRTVLLADANWKFSLGDPAGAAGQSFDDESWRTVTLPHDWSIESAPDEKNNTGGGEGYYPAGIGWYRKTFTAPASWRGKQVSIEFDGVSMNSDVFLNGHKLGFHPYAYTSFRFDITPELKLSSTNTIAVRVDDSKQPNSRWYSGSGIYRHVRIVVTQPIHIAPWGIFLTTPEASLTAGKVHLQTRIENASTASVEIVLETTLASPSGIKLPAIRKTVNVQSGATTEVSQEVAVDHPSLWSPQTPSLYHATTRILQKGRLLDQVETSFGIRSLAWSTEKGLLLNEASIKLAGGSVHHDNGPLGAEAFDRAEERKVELLKAAGFNAVRTAHNPPSPAFLDACDRLGLLVIDEPFDVWTVSKRKYDYAQFFKEWWRQDIDAMVERDRNHPSIVMWGIGNEIPEVWTQEGAPLAEELSSRVRALDSTRPLTQAFPGATYGPNPDAAIAKVDIAGYNYNLAQNMTEDHRRVPARIMMTTESFPADAFEQWQLVQDHPYVVGEFVWTAMDYLGESGIGAWSYGTPKQAAGSKQMKNFLRGYMAKMGADGKNPMEPFQKGQPPNPLSPGFPWHGSYCGDLDLTGFRKPISHYRDILWNGGDRVFATVRLPETADKAIVAGGWSVYPSLSAWTWPGFEGKPLTVEVYSGAERVRLYLNNKLLGDKPTGRDQAFMADFEVPYEAGTLKVVGLRGDREVAEDTLQTTGKPALLRLTADRTALNADSQDLAFVTVEAVDEQGRLVTNGDHAIRFSISGAGTVAAVGSGDTQSRDSYAGNTFSLFNGRAIVIVRTTNQSGAMKLSASSAGLTEASITLHSKQSKVLPYLR